MINKDLKRFNLVVSTSITAAFEAAINLIANASIRQVLNPIAVVSAFMFSVFIMHLIKCMSKNMQIKNLEEEIAYYQGDSVAYRQCQSEILKLRREKNKIDIW